MSRKILEVIANAVDAVLGSSMKLEDPAVDVPVFQEDIIENDAPLDLPDMMSQSTHKRSTLQRVQYLCRTYGIVVHKVGRSV